MANDSKRWKGNQIAVIVLFALAAFLGWQNEQRVLENKGRLHVRQAVSAPDTVFFTWRSEIDAPMAKRMAESFDEWKGDVSTIVIELDSPGGSLGEGRQVIELMQRMKRTHKIETRVSRYAHCLSMCVPIFLQGQRRVAAPSSKWMFHEPTSVDVFSGEEINRPGFEKQFETTRFFNRYFKNSEMDPTWGAALEKQWIGKDVWKTGKELVDEGSGIVMELQ